jgi:glycosyltransferase involved in cell wall biosynthesis
MRLLYIADSTSVHTQRWLAYFHHAGHEVHLVTIGHKLAQLPGVQHERNFEKFYYLAPSFLPVLLQTQRIVRRVRPDILHAHFVHQYGWLAALTGFHPLVLTAWGTDILQLPRASRTGLGRYLTRMALRKADALTAISAHLKAEMVGLGARPERVHVVFLGVDTTVFRPDLDTRPLRKRLGIPPRAPVILSNRNHIALYNNDIVLAALPAVRGRFPDAVLLLQNAGGPLEPALRRQAAEMGLAGAVRFLPQMQHADLPPLYALADVYVSVPSWDAGPLSLLEAMASYAAPVVSDLPAPREWVQDGANGAVVPVRDAERLAAAVRDLLADPQRRDALNRLNRRMIVERADHRTRMAQVDGLYRALVAPCRGRNGSRREDTA